MRGEVVTRRASAERARPAPGDFIEQHELGINRPNPFDRLTTISFALARRERVELEIMDIAGRRVATIASGEYAAGHHDVIWDGRDERGGLVTAGVYVYRLRAGTTVRSRKLLVRP